MCFWEKAIVILTQLCEEVGTVFTYAAAILPRSVIIWSYGGNSMLDTLKTINKHFISQKGIFCSVLIQ